MFKKIFCRLVLFVGLAIYPGSKALAHCQDYWTPAYKAMMGCGGSAPAPGQAAPVYTGPSSAEIAAQRESLARQQAAEAKRQREITAGDQNKLAIKAWHGGNAELALKYSEEALANWPDNPVLQRCVREATENLREATQRQHDEEARQAENKTAVNNMQRIIQNFGREMNNSSVSSGGLDFDQTSTASKPPTGANGALEFGDPMVVDARNVPSGLPKSVDDAIASGYSGAPAGVSDRVRKGFQAITAHDWKVARAWFGDALNHDPDNAGLKRLVELADYTEKHTHQGNTSRSVDPSSAQPPIELPKDSDMQYLFPDWKPSNGSSTSAGSQMQMPKDSDIYFLFPGLRATEAKEMNDYVFDQALKTAENDPVLLKLANRPDSTKNATQNSVFQRLGQWFSPPKINRTPKSVAGVRD